MRDARLRARDASRALVDACASDDARTAQRLKNAIIQEFGVEALAPSAHEALLSLYCRARLCALAERAFADALRAGAPPSDDVLWAMIDAFERSGEPWKSKAVDVVAYIDRRSA